MEDEKVVVVVGLLKKEEEEEKRKEFEREEEGQGIRGGGEFFEEMGRGGEGEEEQQSIRDDCVISERRRRNEEFVGGNDGQKLIVVCLESAQQNNNKKSCVDNKNFGNGRTNKKKKEEEEKALTKRQTSLPSSPPSKTKTKTTKTTIKWQKQQRPGKRLKLLKWLRNLTPEQREAALHFLLASFKRYARIFIAGLSSSGKEEEKKKKKKMEEEENGNDRKKKIWNESKKRNSSKNKVNENRQSDGRTRHLASRLLKRAFLLVAHQNILPRLPPFHCPKCGFMSRRMHSLENHICTRRAHEYKNVKQTTALGFRSRCRDALAVMERIARPQSIQFRKHQEMDISGEGMPKLGQPKLLSEIAWNVVQKAIKLDKITTMHIRTSSFQKEQQREEEKEEEEEENFGATTSSTNCCSMQDEEKNFSQKRQPRSTKAQLREIEIGRGEGVVKEKVSFSTDGRAFFCRGCARLFGKFNDWSAHFGGEEDDFVVGTGKCRLNVGGRGGEGNWEGATAGPLEVQVEFEQQFPVSGKFISAYGQFLESLDQNTSAEERTLRQKKVVLPPPSPTFWSNERAEAAVCTKCFATRFSSRTEFHTHIFKCAMLCGIADEEATTRLLSTRECVFREGE